MSLVYKSSVRENITDLQTYIVDTTPTSTKYFRVSDVPQVLQKGKNLLRITAHPTNLVPGSQVYVDVRDSNGNPIYYEIPDYLEEDKSRVISIWIYHDKGEDNTPNGEAIITLAGTANVDENGNVLPERHRGKINVKWQRVVTVDRNRSNTSEIIFKSDNLPNVIISQSVESYQNQPQSDDGLLQTTQTGKASYIKSGFSPIVQLTDGTEFNSEMVGGSIILSNYTEVAQPQTSIENPLSSTFYSSSISGLLNSTAAKVTTAYTTSFENREDLTHTYTNISEADYEITYYQSGSNITTENFRNFVTLTFNNVDPITGVVDKIKILQKSEGLPGDYELLNEVAVPFSSSLEVKVPIPSKNLNDPKILKLQYLNSVGSISRTETITTPFVFEGDNVYIGGSQNMISGSIFISNTLGTGIEIGGASSGFIRSVGYEGITSASLGKGPGGFVIYSGSGNLVFGEDNLDGVGVEFVGDNDDRHFIFTTANGGLLDVKTDKFFIGTENTQFISGSDGNIEISSSLFHLDPNNNLLVIGADAVINADLSVNNLRTPAQIGGAPSTDLNASSSIKSDGFARFVSASVGGWDITTASIEGANLIMKPEGILQTKDYIKDLKGWIISSENNGFAEFENIKIRGTLSTTTFEKESVNAVGGQLYVANSTTLSGSFTQSVSYGPTAGVTSSTTLPAQLSDNLGDAYLDYNSTQYKISSVDSTTEFTLSKGSIQAVNDSAILVHSQSDSGNATISAYGVSPTTVETPLSASITNINQLAKLTTKFDFTNFTQIAGNPTRQQFIDATGFTVSASGLTIGGSPVGNVFNGSATGTGTLVDEDTIALDAGYALSSKVDAGGYWFMYFDSSSNTTEYTSSNLLSIDSGFVVPDDFTDGEITFNDGSGIKTYTILEKLNAPERIKVDTGSYAPNTSGSSVAAVSAYSSSQSDSITINAFTPTTTDVIYTNVSPSASGLMVDNASGFANDEILTLKKVTSTGFSTEYVKIWSSSRFDESSDTDLSGVIYVTRSYGSAGGDSGSLGDTPGAAQSYEAGQVIVSTGKVGSGYIRINANPNDTSTPYIDIVERTGSGLYDVELKARLGDLSGLSDTPLVLNKSNPGFGLATDNVYLQGGISATFGDIGGFGITQTAISSSNDNLILKSNGQITGSTVLLTGGTITGSNIDINVDKFFVGNPNSQYVSGSNGNLEISSSDFYLSADGSVVIGGNAQIDGDLIIGQVGSLPTNENLRIYLDFEEGDGTILFNKANPSEDFEILGSGYERVSGSNGIAVGNGLTLGGSAAVSASSGNHQIDIIHDGATSDYTQSINLWIKPNSLADGKQIIYEQGGSTSGQMIWMNNSVLYFSAWTNSAGFPYSFYSDALTTGLTDTSPVCVGVSMDYENMTTTNPPTFKLYINGELNQTSSPSEGYAWEFGDNEIGIGDVQGTSRIDITVADSGTSINATNNAGTYAFHGSIDELRVYKQILTDAEFKGLYLNPAGIAAGTKISGDSIQTGKITSNNFSTTAGSQLDLNQGTIKMGGSSNPGFEVTTGGFVTATNLTEKVLEVTVSNSGSYLETYLDAGGNRTRLVLDGTLGGNIGMNMKLSVAPPNPIGDIQLPNQSDGTIQRADIIIDTTGIQFDDGLISAGADATK